MILLLMCAAIGLTQAQAQLSFGVKAGANFSTISKIDLSSIGPGGKALSGLFESKYMPGYHVGLYTRYNLTPGRRRIDQDAAALPHPARALPLHPAQHRTLRRAGPAGRLLPEG